MRTVAVDGLKKKLDCSEFSPDLSHLKEKKMRELQRRMERRRDNI